ncbi:hypothetical protein BH23THE1_BH23THE1_23310 [soil metagenome]
MTRPDINLSTTNMFLSFDILVKKVREFACLFIGSIATYNQISSEPTLISVSSIMYSEILFPFDNNLVGLYY